MPKMDGLFEVMIETGASDLHLMQGQPPKLRLQGKMQPIEGQPPLTEESISELLSEITYEGDWEKFLERGDLDFAYTHVSRARFRANYLRHFYGFGAVFRIIPSKILTLEQLNVPDVVEKLCSTKSGLILVTGPTGSGKSTTLAGIINHINATMKKKIITIEEPVEFVHKNQMSIVNHREVGLDTKSFASGLRAAIKSDANVILVGEMRDKETIELALAAAKMGILVFGTLHTNSAAKTVDRIIDTFPGNQKSQARTILSNALEAVIA